MVDERDLERLSAEVARTMGLRPDRQSILRAVNLGATRSQLSPGEYARKLLVGPRGVLDAPFVHHLVIPETYFYRIAAHWHSFRDHVVPALVRQRGAPRIWCAGCSTGEEPYTIAMELARAAVSATLYATDLSHDSLTAAERGVYRRGAFRQEGLPAPNEFFTETREGFAIAPGIRDRVSFSQLNLADAVSVSAFIASHGQFDVIFCRNVLIYFDDDLCRSILSAFVNALTPEGVLFLGPAEFPARWSDALEIAERGDALVWRRRRSPPQTKVPMVVKRTTVPLQLAQKPTYASPPDEFHLFRAASSPPRDKRDVLGEARQFLSRNELCPRAHVLFGLALESHGDDSGAIRAFERALFLVPSCSYAYWKISLIRAREGRTDLATFFARSAVRHATDPTTMTILELQGEDPDAFPRITEETLQWVSKMRA